MPCWGWMCPFCGSVLASLPVPSSPVEWVGGVRGGEGRGERRKEGVKNEDGSSWSYRDMSERWGRDEERKERTQRGADNEWGKVLIEVCDLSKRKQRGERNGEWEESKKRRIIHNHGGAGKIKGREDKKQWYRNVQVEIPRWKMKKTGKRKSLKYVTGRQK